MKLYIKQKVFSWGDKFTVKDEAGRDRYYVEGEIFTFGRKLHVYDMSGREVAFIKQEVWSWMPRYYVFCGDRQVAEIKKEFTFLFPKYNIEVLCWEINGSSFNIFMVRYTSPQAGHFHSQSLFLAFLCSCSSVAMPHTGQVTGFLHHKSFRSLTSSSRFLIYIGTLPSFKA